MLIDPCTATYRFTPTDGPVSVCLFEALFSNVLVTPHDAILLLLPHLFLVLIVGYLRYVNRHCLERTLRQKAFSDPSHASHLFIRVRQQLVSTQKHKEFVHCTKHTRRTHHSRCCLYSEPQMVTILFQQFYLQIHGNGHDRTY